MSREELKEMLNRQKEVEFYKHQDRVAGRSQQS
jgi:hypothetical protein